MIALRDKFWRRLGASLAGTALYAQLVFAGWGMLALAVADDPADGLGAHALCIAGEAGKADPVSPAPASHAHIHTAFCCLWHQSPGLAPEAAAAPQPVAYAAGVRLDAGDAAFVTASRRGEVKARAPPVPA